MANSTALFWDKPNLINAAGAKITSWGSSYHIGMYKDISKFQDVDFADYEQADVKVFVLRNMNPAALFIGKKFNEDTLEVVLDYAVPQFRDFKLGNYLFEHENEYFLNKGYKKLLAFTDKEEHIMYLEKMGFNSVEIDGKVGFIKTLQTV